MCDCLMIYLLYLFNRLLICKKTAHCQQVISRGFKLIPDFACTKKVLVKIEARLSYNNSTYVYCYRDRYKKKIVAVIHTVTVSNPSAKTISRNGFFSFVGRRRTSLTRCCSTGRYIIYR